MATSLPPRRETSTSASPRPMWTAPGSSSAGWTTSFTETAQSPSNRRARGPVKLSGMCCATTMGHGKSAGRGESRASSAGGPPVEVPTTTTPKDDPFRLTGKCSLSIGPPEDPAAGTAPMRCRTRSRSRVASLGRERAALRTFSTNCAPSSSTRSETAPLGLGTKSTAPRRSASSVASAPAAVSEDTITTGQGRCTMIRSRQVRPSMSGIWTSRVITSGANAISCASASAPLRAVATSKSVSRLKIWPSSFRTRAESSTTRSLITVWEGSPRPGKRRAGRARRA